MTGLYKALRVFWGQFFDGAAPIPAYFSGYVPDKTAFPYVTYEAVDGGSLGKTVLTAHGWFRTENGYNGREHAAAFMDQVKTAIPPQGCKISLSKGFALLFPNDATFLSFVDEPTDHEIIGARISYEIHYYE